MARHPGRRSRYGAWQGGPDPLAPPYDVRAAVDALGEEVLAGASLRDALRDLLRRGPGRSSAATASTTCTSGPAGSAGRRCAAAGWTAPSPARRRCSTRRWPPSGRRWPAGTTTTRGSPRRSWTRCRGRPSRAVQELADYDWTSDEARADYQRILDELREDVLGQRFEGMRAGAAGRRPGERPAGRGGAAVDAGRPERAARPARPRRGHHGQLRRVHAPARRLLPRAAAGRRRAGRPAGPARGRGGAADALAHAGPARGAGRADGAGARPGRGRRADGRAVGEPARAAAGPVLGPRRADPRARSRSATARRPVRWPRSPSSTTCSTSWARSIPGATLDDVDVEAVERQLGRGRGGRRAPAARARARAAPPGLAVAAARPTPC